MANLSPGDGVIDFELPGVDGKNHALADYGGKEVVVVIFSCNHCPYVRAGKTAWSSIQADYADRGSAVSGDQRQ